MHFSTPFFFVSRQVMTINQAWNWQSRDCCRWEEIQRSGTRSFTQRTVWRDVCPAEPVVKKKSFSVKLSSHCVVISHLRSRRSDTRKERMCSIELPRLTSLAFLFITWWVRWGSLLLCPEIHIWWQLAHAFSPWSETTGALWVSRMLAT